MSNNIRKKNSLSRLGRREFALASAGLIATPLLSDVVARAQTGEPPATPAAGIGKRPFPTRAYGATSATSPLAPIQIQRRALSQTTCCSMCFIAASAIPTSTPFGVTGGKPATRLFQVTK